MIAPRHVLHVLAVDDREDNLDLLEAIIDAPDIEVTRARSGVDALALLESSPEFVLAVLDVNMPGMDGFELASKLREHVRTRDIPLLFLTAVAEPTWPKIGYEHGGADFLVKPFPPELLRYRVRALLEMRRQRLIIEETLRINELFIGVLAHDLRSPLAAVVTGCDLLARSEDPLTAKVAQRIRSSGRRMGKLIDVLCDLTQSRLGGGLPVTKRACDAVSVVKRTLEEVQLANPGASIVLEAPATLMIYADEERLEQLVSNLLSNAIRHGDASAPAQVAVRADGAASWIEVTNAGTIAPEDRASLFEPFKRGTAAQGRTDGGLGLGLYIVEQIAIAHDGEVGVESRDGRTSFRVRIPRGEATPG